MPSKETSPLRVMSIMAHQDDFEFNAGGMFALLREHHGDQLHMRILATTRGATGHHEMSLEETFRRRDAEARRSAAIIGADYACMTGLDGSHVHGSLFIDRNTLGGLWNAIRDYEPDFIFCPPVIEDPLAGIHIDHYNTATAVRMVAYQLSVPHAYPTMNGPPKPKTMIPTILNVDDVYARGRGFDLAVDISSVFETKLRMALCHESQIFEWLPWNGGRPAPSPTEYREQFRGRHADLNLRYGLPDDAPREFLRITAWGRKSVETELPRLFPADMPLCYPPKSSA